MATKFYSIIQFRRNLHDVFVKEHRVVVKMFPTLGETLRKQHFIFRLGRKSCVLASQKLFFPGKSCTFTELHAGEPLFKGTIMGLVYGFTAQLLLWLVNQQRPNLQSSTSVCRWSSSGRRDHAEVA